MHQRQRALCEQWTRSGLSPFLLGIGVSTGEVAGALLGSADRMEYTLVGDTVNLADRLQDMARPGGTTVVSEATAAAVTGWPLTRMPARQVKGRTATVRPFQLAAEAPVARPAALVGAGGAGRAA
jgi:class 3 adenylate cyclase